MNGSSKKDTAGKLYLTLCQVVFYAILLGCDVVHAQKHSQNYADIDQYLSALPVDLELQENEPQRYCLTTTWHNRDLYGNTTNKFILTGEYTRALEGDSVRWNNVHIVIAPDPEGSFADTLFQDTMEGFTYKPPEDIAKAGFFKHLPPNETRHALRTLVWDAVAFETFAWRYYHKLKLNEPFMPSDLDDLDVQMADWGTIKMKELKLTWTGLSRMGGELCALIQYESFVNPVESVSPIMSVKGRSLCWGGIWISLEDKQIEYGTLNEDILVEIKSGGDAAPKIIDMQREVKFKKCQ